jgi:hypothetical protein
LIRAVFCNQEDTEPLRPLLARQENSILRESFQIQNPKSNDRNLHIITLLNTMPNSEITFQGLKRKLGWHQEILSRTIKRLERDGVLLKTHSGSYKLSNVDVYQNRYDNSNEEAIPVTQLLLPNDLDPQFFVSNLKNTWFGKWRWYGLGAGVNGQVLTWISEDGGIWVRLKFLDGLMFIEAGPLRNTTRNSCIQAGYELLRHVLRNNKRKFNQDAFSA